MQDEISNPLALKLARLYELSSAEKRILASIIDRQITLKPDQDVIREGDRPTESNMLLAGMTCRYKLMPDGKRQILSFHVPGDIFDAQSFLLESMDHSVATLTRCRLAVISHETLRRLTEEFPRIARVIWKDTLVDASIFREWIASIGRRTAMQRIAHLICEIVTRLDLDTGDTIEMEWPITQTEMADALGLSLVHINRNLKELRSAGLITQKDGRLIIHGWRNLVRAAKFDPAYLHLTIRRPLDGTTVRLMP